MKWRLLHLDFNWRWAEKTHFFYNIWLSNNFWTLEINDSNVQQKWKALYDADTKEAIINLAETPIFTPIKKANTSCHQESEYTHPGDGWFNLIYKIDVTNKGAFQ